MICSISNKMKRIAIKNGIEGNHELANLLNISYVNLIRAYKENKIGVKLEESFLEYFKNTLSQKEKRELKIEMELSRASEELKNEVELMNFRIDALEKRLEKYLAINKLVDVLEYANKIGLLEELEKLNQD